MIASLLVLSDAALGRPKRTAVETQPIVPPVQAFKERLFTAKLPFDIGRLPAGLQGTSAQVCNACHPTAVSQWSRSAHAIPPTQALLDAALGEPECLSCHLPLLAQWDSVPLQPDQATTSPNPSFDATLLPEAVTCAACHIREGSIIVGSADIAARAELSQQMPNMPHESRYTDGLASSELCAPCHQLSIPGAKEPLYDTYGQWKRAGFESIGISCQSCHMTGAADGTLGVAHDIRADPARALTVELNTPTLRLVRGATIPITIAIHNTGAGHNVPTGTPFRGMRVSALLENPSDPTSQPIVLANLDLQRRVEPTLPFATIEDTTIPAGASRRIDAALALPLEAVPGRWLLRITIDGTLQGQKDGPALLDRRWPLTVE